MTVEEVFFKVHSQNPASSSSAFFFLLFIHVLTNEDFGEQIMLTCIEDTEHDMGC